MPTTPAPSLRTEVWTLALAACILSLHPGISLAQGTDSTAKTPLTTLSKVYADAQALKGRQVYLLSCVSCHKPNEYAGETFWGKLVGKTVSDLFVYLRTNMPQDNPGSLGDDDYANVTAYILKLNSMPAGETPLSSDSLALAKIRVVWPDTTRKAPPR